MTTVVERLLAGNDEVDKHEVQQINDAWNATGLKDCRKLLLSQASRPLEDVDVSALTLEICVRRLPALVAVRRVPNEILHDAFSFLLSARDIPSMRSYVAISLVCRRWHDVVKGFRCPPPAIYVAYKIPSRNGYKWTSKDDAPFALSIPYISLQFSNGLWHLSTAKCIALSLSYRPYTLWFAMSNVETAWKSLQTLKLSIPELPPPHNFQSYLFGGAPNLNDVEIHCGSDLFISIPKRNLKRYREHCVSHANSLYAFEGSQMLESVDYTISHETYTLHLYSQSQSCLNFPALTNFDFKVYVSKAKSDADQLRIIEKILFPNITRLRLRIQNDLTKLLKSILHDTAEDIQRSAGLPRLYPMDSQIRLTHLAFYSGRPLQAGEILELLAYTPMITYLECGSIPTLDLGVLGLPMLNRDGTCIAPKLTTLVVHDPDDVEAFITLAKSNYLPRKPYRTIFKVQLLYRHSKDKRNDGVRLGVSNPGDEAHDSLEDLASDLMRFVHRTRASPRVAAQFPLLGREFLDPILKTIRRFEGLSPESVPLSIVQALYALSRVELHLLPGSQPAELHKRVNELYNRLLIIYQLRTWPKPAWVAPGRHCLLFDYDSHIQEEWKPDQPSEYDLLYGRFRPPSQEEVMWPYEDCYEFEDGWLFFGRQPTLKEV